MITAEIRINSILILHVYAHRLDDRYPENRDGEMYRYSWRVHDVETGKTEEGILSHHFNDGANGLIRKILQEARP